MNGANATSEKAVQFAAEWDLTKPLAAEDLQQFTLDELDTISRALLLRAVDVIRDQTLCALDDSDPRRRAAIEARNFAVRRALPSGQVVLKWEGDQKWTLQFFTPGPWFQIELDARERATTLRDTRRARYPETQRERLMSLLINGQR